MYIYTYTSPSLVPHDGALEVEVRRPRLVSEYYSIL